MKKKLLILLNAIMFSALSHGNINDPDYYQCWEEVSYASQTSEEQEFKGKLFEQFNKFVNCVKNNTGKCNKGFILHGTPGNGKSTIATDFAKTVKAYTLKVTGSLEGPYTGTSTERLDRLFEHAKHLAQYNRVVIIIDEIDTLLRSTNNTNDSHSDHKADNAGHFLSLFDALPQDNSITVIGTTNFMKSIDTRLSRKKRFDDFEINNPDDSDRNEILQHYFAKNNIRISENTLKLIVEKTKGFCSAELHQLVDEISIKQSQQTIDDALIKNELNSAIKDHEKHTGRVDEESKRRKKQDEQSDLQIKVLTKQNIESGARIGAIFGITTGAVGAAITMYLFPTAIPDIIAHLAAASAGTAAATTTAAVATTSTAATIPAVTFIAAVKGGATIGGGLGSVIGATVAYKQ